MFRVESVQGDQVRDYLRVMMWAAGRALDDDLVASAASSWDPEHALAAFDASEMIGTIGTRSLEMALPGALTVPVACIGQGGVLPSHSGRGAMRQLMLESLARAADGGAVCAAWTTSEWPLYGRYGGGAATFAASYRLDGIRSARIESPMVGEVRLATSAEVGGRIVALHERASRRPGAVPRETRYWRERLRRADLGLPFDPLDFSGPAPPAMYALRRPAPGADPDGCAIYRIHQRWEGGLCRSELEVVDLLAADDPSAADLWRFLLGLALVDSLVVGHAPLDTALRWLLHDGRQLQTTAVFDHVWLRVLDAERALASRAYPGLHEPLEITIEDPLGYCDGQSFVLQPGGDDRAELRCGAATGKEAIEIDVAALSILILGSGTAPQLAAAGLLPGLSDRQVWRLQQAFAAERAPYCDNSF